LGGGRAMHVSQKEGRGEEAVLRGDS
jgi:hypothetical protein